MPEPIIVDHPLVQHKLAILRDRGTPTPEFRRLLREISQLLAWEVTRDLPLVPSSIETPLCTMRAQTLAGPEPALVSVLRAGNGLLDGMLELLPASPVGFIGLQRDETTLEPAEYYCKLPDRLDERTVLLLDPMLATGNTATAAIQRLKDSGAQDIRFLCVVAAPEGVARLQAAHPDIPIVTAALDERLSDEGWIVPGLGDAGDRIYGTGSP